MADEIDPKKVPKLTQLNYSDWVFLMRNYLAANALMGPIDHTLAFLALSPDEQIEKQNKTFLHLTLALGADYIATRDCCGPLGSDPRGIRSSNREKDESDQRRFRQIHMEQR